MNHVLAKPGRALWRSLNGTDWNAQHDATDYPHGGRSSSGDLHGYQTDVIRPIHFDHVRWHTGEIRARQPPEPRYQSKAIQETSISSHSHCNRSSTSVPEVHMSERCTNDNELLNQISRSIDDDGVDEEDQDCKDNQHHRPGDAAKSNRGAGPYRGVVLGGRRGIRCRCRWRLRVGSQRIVDESRFGGRAAGSL